MFVALVWENTVRSTFLSPSIAALLIVVYFSAGKLAAWVRDRHQVAIVTVAATVALSLGLLLATHNLLPFDISVLCVAATSEVTAGSGGRLGQRCVAAFGADLAILITAWIFSQPASLPEGFTPYSHLSVLAIQLALVLVYLGSTLYRALTTQITITGFEIGQNGIAIGLFILGQLVMGPTGNLHAFPGYICAVLALIAYPASIKLARQRVQGASVAYGVYGLALLTAATAVLLPPDVQVFVWSILGAAAAWVGNRESQLSFSAQAPVYLFAAALACGLIAISAQPLTDVVVPRNENLVPLLVTAGAVSIAYALASSGRADRSRITPLLCEALLGVSVLSLGAIVIKALFGGLFFATSLRVGIICLAAIGSARWGRSRRVDADRPERIWLSYPLMVYGVSPILIEDLPSRGPGATALSLLVYGSALLVLTRILRARHPT